MSGIAIGDLVIRKSHGGDIVFKVTDILCDENGNQYCVLKGMHLRLLADAPLDDLEQADGEHVRSEILQTKTVYDVNVKRAMLRRCIERKRVELMRSDKGKKYDFFDLPGRVLHLDGDDEYLKMCLKTYGQLNMEAVGRCIDEEKQPEQVVALVDEYRPDILVLTGHDALVGNGKRDFKDMNNYRNSRYYVESVKKVRAFEPSRDDLVIFAGACQSYFEAILGAGSNFASSPTRIFIHAYDPVFIAEKVAFTPIDKTVDVGDAIAASVSGVEGVGGIETRGKFRLGLPKTPYK